MRRIVLPVACFCGLWTTASAQSVQPPSESGIASWYGAPYHGQRSVRSINPRSHSHSDLRL